MRGTAPAAAVALLGAALSGCNILGPITYYLGPPRIQKAEFPLTSKGRVAVVVDYVRREQENPVFSQTLVEKLIDIFRERKSSTRIVPPEELLDLRKRHRDFREWSLQRIGRELEAEQVLALRVENLTLRVAPDDPVVYPRVVLRVMVIGSDRPPERPRLWPDEPEGREVPCSRPPQEAGDIHAHDLAAIKLARDTAHLLATLFFDTDLEQPIPKEP
jgi:hypothetical protein